MIADAKSGDSSTPSPKEVDFATSLLIGPYRNSTSRPRSPCASSPRGRRLPRGFYFLCAVRRRADRILAAPVIDQGAVIGALIAQLSNEEIDNVVTSDRRWFQEGWASTGEAYLVGSDNLVRSAPRAFYENCERYFAELKMAGLRREDITSIERYGTPVLHQHIDTEATRAALAGVEGIGEIIGNAASRRSPHGVRSPFRA